MDKAAEIRQRLKQMASEFGPENTLLAQVKEVDEANFVCNLYDEESELDFYDVRLRPVIDGKESLTIVPKLNSWVLAVRIEGGDEWMVLAVGEAEKFLLKCDNIIINGGTKGGLVNWPDAKVQHDLVRQFITAFKNVLSTPINEPGNGAPSAFHAALSAAMSAINPPNFDNLEDTKVKH